MAPKTDGELRKRKSVNFKSLLYKFVSHKQKKEEAKDDDDGHYVVDALPAMPRPQKKPSVGSVEDGNIDDSFKEDNCHEPEETNNGEKNKEDIEENYHEKNTKTKSRINDKKRKQEEYNRYSKKSSSRESLPVFNETNIIVNNGTGIHIGNVFNSVNNVYYGGETKSNQDKSKIRMTNKIKDLFEIKDKVEAGHLDILATHFGIKWKEVGKFLGLTTGELQTIEDVQENRSLKELAYQMLRLWWQQRGDKASIGGLCTKLWKTKIEVAREAVYQLSLDIDLFK